MRVAVTLPTLPDAAPHRRGLNAALAALVAHGLDIEAFAERPRDRDGRDPFPVFHYLRLAARHRASPFDTGLALLGRDMRAYEPPYLSMHRFPGAVWVLDPVVHHLMIGGVLAWGRWDEYAGVLEQEYGPETGAAMTQTVAAGWGVDSLYRTRDPLLARVARQPAACAATPAIARALQGAGATSAQVVPLPAPGVPEAGPASADADTSIFLLRPNYAWPEPALRGLGEVLRNRPEVSLTICAPEVVLAAGLRFPAGHEWLRERVRWVGPGDWDELHREIDRAGIVVHLLDDPTVGERALIERAMAAGSAVVLLDAPGTDVWSPGSVARIEPGRGQGRALAATLEALLADDVLRGGLAAAARREIAGRPDAAGVASALAEVLERSTKAGFEPHDSAHLTWRRLRASVETKALPRCADRSLEGRLRERLRRAAPAGFRAALD